MNRIDKANWSGQSPMIAPPAIRYELADRIQAIGAGGLGVIPQMQKQLGLAEDIIRICPMFKMHLPYSEADHVLNIAFNLLAGSGALESAIRRVINLRVKSNSTYWLRENAETMIRLRAWLKAGRAEELFTQTTYVASDLVA